MVGLDSTVVREVAKKLTSGGLLAGRVPSLDQIYRQAIGLAYCGGITRLAVGPPTVLRFTASVKMQTSIRLLIYQRRRSICWTRRLTHHQRDERSESYHRLHLHGHQISPILRTRLLRFANLPELMSLLRDDDYILITADHGNVFADHAHGRSKTGAR